MIHALVLLTASFVESPAVPEVTVSETVIVAPSPTERSTSRPKIWVCESEWHDSMVGGQFRRCEWVARGSEPKGF